MHKNTYYFLILIQFLTLNFESTASILVYQTPNNLWALQSLPDDSSKWNLSTKLENLGLSRKKHKTALDALDHALYHLGDEQTAGSLRYYNADVGSRKRDVYQFLKRTFLSTLNLNSLIYGATESAILNESLKQSIIKKHREPWLIESYLKATRKLKSFTEKVKAAEIENLPGPLGFILGKTKGTGEYMIRLPDQSESSVIDFFESMKEEDFEAIPLKYVRENSSRIFELESTTNPYIGPTTFIDDPEKLGEDNPIQMRIYLGPGIFRQNLLFEQTVEYDEENKKLITTLTLQEPIKFAPGNFNPNDFWYRYEITEKDGKLNWDFTYQVPIKLFREQIETFTSEAFRERQQQFVSEYYQTQSP